MKPLPLAGKTVLVTRARPQASAFSTSLAELGAKVIEVPTIEIVPIVGPELDASIKSLAQYDWLFFTSANGVRIFFERMKEENPTGKVQVPKICSIGPATSQEVREFGYDIALQPSLFQAEGIIQEFTSLYAENLPNLRILIPRARRAREILPETLRDLGAVVDVIAVYDTRAPRQSGAPLLSTLKKTKIDLITFTSSSTVHNFVSLAKGTVSLSDFKCAAIGPITAQTAREHGLQIVLQPSSSTIPDFVRAIEEYLQPRG